MFDWGSTTEPFVNESGNTPARFVLEQVEDAKFMLREPFNYRQTDGTNIEVTANKLGRTDLASIPRVMSWFVSRHGRHTPAALLHDQLVVDGMDAGERAKADRIFLQAMDDLAVPPVRSRLMWAAVSAATRWSGGSIARLGIVAWALCSAAGTAALAVGAVTGNTPMVAISLLGPIVGSILWGSAFRQGLIGGYAIPAVILPAVASWLGYAIYWLVETAVRFARKALPANKGEPLPKPVAYREA